MSDEDEPIEHQNNPKCRGVLLNKCHHLIDVKEGSSYLTLGQELGEFQVVDHKIVFFSAECTKMKERRHGRCNPCADLFIRKICTAEKRKRLAEVHSKEEYEMLKKTLKMEVKKKEKEKKEQLIKEEEKKEQEIPEKKEPKEKKRKKTKLDKSLIDLTQEQRLQQRPVVYPYSIPDGQMVVPQYGNMYMNGYYPPPPYMIPRYYWPPPQVNGYPQHSYMRNIYPTPPVIVEVEKATKEDEEVESSGEVKQSKSEETTILQDPPVEKSDQTKLASP